MGSLSVEYLFLPLVTSLKNTWGMWFPLPSTNSTELQRDGGGRGEAKGEEEGLDKLLLFVFLCKGIQAKDRGLERGKKIPPLKRGINSLNQFHAF